MEVVDLSMPKYPNRDALRQANDIYLDAMRPFIIRLLNQVPGEAAEDLIQDALMPEQQNAFWQKLDETDDIEAAIDFNYFPQIVRRNWDCGFAEQFNNDLTVQSMLWLIRKGRNSCEHRGTTDIDYEFVRTNLFLIAEVLGKINRPNERRDVEVIRDELDDTAERLATAEERLKEMEAENAEYKKNLAGTKQRLEKSEAVQTNYKEDLDATTKKLEEVKRKCRATEDSLKATSDRLEDAVDEWMASVERLTALQKLFTTAAIESQKVQAIFPPFEIDSAVRILDRRGTDKRNYLSRLLDQKQSTIIYVQSEDKIHQLLDLVGPEKAAVIGRHSEQTSETEETEILKKLENRELIAAVSNTTFSELQRYDCVEHFVFCHLVPNVDEFFKRCQPAFASEKDSYLHLIYESKQKIEELKQKYPKDELLRKLYQKIRNLTPIGKFINFEDIHSKLCKDDELDTAKLGFKTGLAIFEELGLIKQNGETIERLGDVQTELNKSKTYCVGAELKKEIENSPNFQYENSIEQIWEKMLEALNIDSEQILRESNIHKMPLRVSKTEGDYLKDSQTQPEQSTEVVEKDNAASDATLEAHHTSKPTRANAKVTEEQVREIRARHEVGESYSKLAKEFNLSSAAVRNIALRKTWKDVE